MIVPKVPHERHFVGRSDEDLYALPFRSNSSLEYSARMKSRLLTLLVPAGLIAITWLATMSTFAATPRLDRPNIIVILADDLGYGDLTVNNPDSKIPTPRLDQLAREGMNFTDAHSPSGVCTPTRYGLLTGRYCWRTRLKRGVLKGSSAPLIEPGRLTLPGMLKSIGYETGAFGKWHLGRRWALRDPQAKVTAENIDWTQPALYCPLDAGFTYTFELSRPAWAFMENRLVLVPPTEPFDRTHIPSHIVGGNNNKGYQQPGFTFEAMLPKWIEKATAFIDRCAKAKQPFFTYFAPICPHRPINPNREFHGKSQCGVFGDFVVELDTAVGNLLDQLKASGVADDTLVIFSADNGAENNAYQHIEEYGHWSSGGRRGCKRDLYEGGHHVPFMARWPNQIPAGQTSEEIICLTDLMATIAHLVGEPLPLDAGEDSYNIWPAMQGKAGPHPIREATVHHSGRGQFAIRQGDWVFLEAPSGSNNREPASVRESLGVKPHRLEVELFNLKDDPNQTTNLADRFPDKVKELKQLLVDYRSRPRSRPTQDSN